MRKSLVLRVFSTLVIFGGLFMGTVTGCSDSRGSTNIVPTSTPESTKGQFYEPFPGPTTEYAQAGSETAEGAGQQLD